jgi:phospholipid transport system substrate-binding protein
VLLARYAGEQIAYTGQVIEGGHVTVRSKVVIARNVHIPIEYRLCHTGERWAVYDVVIEGVNLIGGYRDQRQIDGVPIPLPRRQPG